jgi:hypothetical protein
MNNYLDDKQKLKQARHDAAQLTIFHLWIQENPQWDYQAAREMIQIYYDGEDWTAENLTESAERLAAKGTIKPLHPKTEDDVLAEEAEERAALTAWIMSNRTFASPESRRTEQARLSNATLTGIHTLRQIKQNVETKRRLAALSAEELKKQADEEFKAQQAAHGIRSSRWLPVPLIYQTRSMLLSLASENTAEFRQLVRRCGEQQINAILAKRDED